MRRVTETLVATYRTNDWIADLLPTPAVTAGLLMDRWLVDSLPKRAIFAALYGDLLRPEATDLGRRVLDVGGGISALTAQLARNSDYSVLDLLAHDGHTAVSGLEVEVGRRVLLRDDWYGSLATLPPYDILIANDLFPNVDQRLELFLDRALPRSREVRLSLTFYNSPRFYMCKRVDADELMCLLAWSGGQTSMALRRYADRIVNADFTVFDNHHNSVFPNGRHVVLVTLQGMRP